MTLATLGWALVWGSFALAKLGWAPRAEWVYVLAAGPAAVGMGYAVLSARARRAWLFMALVAVFANGSLLGLPFLFDEEVRSALSRQ